MSARRRTIDLDSLLSFIREHGPLTKTELYSKVLGYPTSRPLMAALHELENKRLIIYCHGKAKSSGRVAMVYEVRAG